LSSERKQKDKKVEYFHGVLVDVAGVGVLILGRSGIGKSECALELILKGHRLVADDVVCLELDQSGKLYGYGLNPGRTYMEIRGLGIVDVEKLFGIAALKPRKRLHLVIELVDPEEIQDRTGMERRTMKILGVDVPCKRIPVTPGRNLSAIVEVAARNFLLEERGVRAPEELDALIRKKAEEE
jgi:HPr kinase/phosphorylase